MLSPGLLIVAVVFLTYLCSLSPTILWRDTPEFANVGFTLSIAHPAGFPTYSLLGKALTFIPLGNVAFKTNLASAIFSVLSVIVLSAAIRLLLNRLYPESPTADVSTSSILASLLFALGPIVWHNAAIAEVYTLNVLFIAGLVYVVLRWLDNSDSRWLFLGAFLYGLSAGNHATVALFLPGLLALYFINRRRGDSNEWTRAFFFFLLGLSVYLYLPVRSLANPPYDWGDPQNLKNFLYQVTDQKDFGVSGALSESNGSIPFALIFSHLSLLAAQFSPVGIALILLGITPVLRKEKGLAVLLVCVLFSNHAFFWRWTSGDAFLPSYFALTFFLGTGTCTLLGMARKWSHVTASQIRKLVAAGLIGLVALHAFFTYPKVNKRDYYLPSDLFRTPFTSLSPNSVLITEFQWFPVKYFKDVQRLREDVSVLSLSEVTQPRAFHYITPERFPRLVIPNVEQDSKNAVPFINELVIQNHQAGHAVFRELTERLNEHMKIPIVPHQDFVFRIALGQRPAGQTAIYVRQVKQKLLNKAKLQPHVYDPDLHLYLDHYVGTVARYLYDERDTPDKAVFLLKAYLQTYGSNGSGSIDDENLSILYNSLGLYELRMGQVLTGLKSLELAIKINPKNPSPYLNLMLWYVDQAPVRFGEILERARGNGLNPKEICATFIRYLRKEGLTKQSRQALALCGK